MSLAIDADAPIRTLLIVQRSGYSGRLMDKLNGYPGRSVTLHTEATMASGESALAAQAFDLIMVDLDLVDAKGVEAFERARRASSGLPIIVLGGPEDLDACRLCVRCGAEDYLLKDDRGIAASASALYKVLERCWLKRNMLGKQQSFDGVAKHSEDGVPIVGESELIQEAKTKERLEGGVPPLQAADSPKSASYKKLNSETATIDVPEKSSPPLAALFECIATIETAEDFPRRLKPQLAGLRAVGEKLACVTEDKIENGRRAACDSGAEGDYSFLAIASDIRALVVEDADGNFEMLCSMLAHHDRLHLVRAENIARARKALLHDDWDIILTSHALPDGCSFDLLSEIEGMGVDAPVVVLASQGDETVASRLAQAGVYDYLPKSLLRREVLHRTLRGALEKHRLLREAQAIEKRLADMAFRDELTGLHNRRFLNERLAHELERARRYGSDLACLMIDLDHFKYVNDAFGHPFGDVVLREFSAALKKLVRATDMLFRIGGEEIIALLPDTGIEGALNVAEKIRDCFEKKTYQCGDDSITVTVSIGVATSKKHNATDNQTMLSYTDKALYRAKAEGRNRVTVYEESEGQLTGVIATAFFPVQYIREQLSLILDKTKQAAVAAIQRLIMDRNAMGFQVHNQRVLNCLELMGRELNVSPHFMGAIKRAAQMHDYLKVILSEGLLNQAGPLTEAQRAELEEHPYMLAECANIFDFFADERECLISHHERYDGLGYPEGLSGDQIPLGARLLAIVDAFVAMTSERPYRPRLSDEEVVREFANNAGKQFDPTLTAAFLEIAERNDLLKAPREILQRARDALGSPAGIRNRL